MSVGKVVAICIGPSAGASMISLPEVQAIAGEGLEGDRYARGEGSFNKGKKGNRQVTLINGKFFKGSSFSYIDCRRNLVTLDIELMWLLGKEFRVGNAVLRGVKY